MIQKIKDRAELFYKSKIPVHVELKDKIYYNGYLLEVGVKHILILDRIDGRRLVFMPEIAKIEGFFGYTKTLPKPKSEEK